MIYIKKNVYLSIDHATGNKIPTVLLDMILDYTPPSDIDLTLQNDHIVFFDPKEINRLLERENEIARTFPPKKNHRNALWLCQFFYNNIKNIFHTNENKLKIK